MNRNLVHMYRTAEDYRRYTSASPNRQKELTEFFGHYRRFFGRRVLDLGCGGGVLGSVLESTRRTYVGMDANPDMIREARRAATERGSAQRFVLGDICRTRIAGRFDTLTLIGNSLGHLNVAQMDELLRMRKANVRAGTRFLIDYRDMVAMFWNGTWPRVKVQTHVVGRVVHRTQRVDLEGGRLHMRAKPGSGAWVLEWAHAIWSPFILDSIMRSHGWRLISRSPMGTVRAKAIPEHYLDVYRFEGKR